MHAAHVTHYLLRNEEYTGDDGAGDGEGVERGWRTERADEYTAQQVAKPVTEPEVDAVHQALYGGH